MRASFHGHGRARGLRAAAPERGFGRAALRAPLALLLCASCGPNPPAEPPLEAELDAALGRAATFLRDAQAPDGRFPSAVYGNLRDGSALTPTVLKVLLFSPVGPGDASGRDGMEGVRSAIATLVEAAGRGPARLGLGYPVYTAALAVTCLAQPAATAEPGAPAALETWLAYLGTHQLDERLGWRPDDLAYGGFGYSLSPPQRPAGGEGGARPAFDADLSSTLFALGALRLAGRGADDPAVRRALTFVERCQNFEPGAPVVPQDPRRDGGFCFTPTNAGQNKAGVSGTDASGRERYRSYGAMTADGVRALLRCGLPRDHPRVVGAADWLARHFDPASNPGDFEAAREVERDASYYYWCWSAAHAFRALDLRRIETPAGPVDWTEALSGELLARQRSDGSWANPLTMVKEDDPLIATSFAAAALGLARLQRAR